MSTDIKTELKKLPLEESMDLVQKVASTNEVLLFQSRLSDLQYNNRHKLLMPERYQIELNTLQINWYEQIDLLTDEDVQKIGVSLFTNVSPVTLLKKLHAASSQLNHWRSVFQNTGDFHLKRKETDHLLAWINAPLAPNEKGIALLTGNPGVGKSVVLRDVLQELNNQDVPALGIKADRYYVDSIEALEKKLYISEGIEPIIRTLARTNERVVILIDQIDALSQSLSTRREFLDTFIQLVELLSDIPNIRIVLSCRTFDLQYDHDLAFYRNQKHFKIEVLSPDEVKMVLERFPNKTPKLPEDLLELLRTPLLLDIFCQIHQKGVELDKIKTLRDLYEGLWEQKFLEVPSPPGATIDPNKCVELAFETAQAMYDEQTLAISKKIFRGRFVQELKYLKSTGILLESQDGLTFFHQTFYDFVFAKRFIKNGQEIENYLIENDQNLHIRACLKMMIEFMRETNSVEYLRVYKLILASPDFYFHVKFLLVSLLGFVKKPTKAEIRLIREFVLPDENLAKAFVASINSQAWLLFLLREKYLARMIEADILIPTNTLEHERQDSRIGGFLGLLLRHLPECRAEVLVFVEQLSDEFEFKIWFVERILSKLDAWDDPIAFKLFDAYHEKLYESFVTDYLKKSAESELDWAFDWTMEHLKKAIRKQVEAQHSSYKEVEFDHNLTDLLEFYIEKHPETIFDLLFDVLKGYLRNSESEDNNYSVIVCDFPWYSISFDKARYDHSGLLTLLGKCIRTLSHKSSPRFERFIEETSSGNSVAMLLLLVEGLRENPSIYTDKIFQFLINFINKRGVDAFHTLSQNTRFLLKETYHYFSDFQKLLCIQSISVIESEVDRKLALENNQEIGYERLMWLNCIPASDLTQIPEIMEMRLDLKRKFPKAKELDTTGSVLFGIGPPLPAATYASMNLAEWRESFITFDEKYQLDWHAHTGGLTEHARQFEQEVKKRPDFFYPFIASLIGDETVSKEYLVSGLQGLKEAKYSPEKLLDIFKRIDYSTWSSRQTYWLVSICGYFVQARIEDDYYMHFLAQMATNHPDPQDGELKVIMENDANASKFNSGFNSVRGHASYLLTHCFYFKKHEELIFITLENASIIDSAMVCSQTMPRLALLTNLNPSRTLQIFLQLMRRNEEVVMEHSAWSAQYLTRHNFEVMKPYFINMLALSKIHKDMGIILTLTWIFEHDDSLELLERFFEVSDKAKASAIEVAAHNIRDKQGLPISKSLQLFERFLEETNDDVIQAYDLAFRHLKTLDFPHIHPMLMRFAKSVVIRKNPRPFYEYLIACASKYPDECLQLVENFDQFERPDMRYAIYYNSEPLKLVINAYNALRGSESQYQALLKKALRLFDRMLLDDRFRGEAENALDWVER